MRTAVVTGGSLGIGRAIASRLAADGFSVVVLARDAERARDLPGSAVACDVTDYASVAAARAAIGDVVSGGSLGIGRAIASRLAADGFSVVVLVRDVERARDLPGSAVACDVTDYASVVAARSAIGDVDVLVNNAGFDEFQPFLDTDPAGWQPLIAVNLMGVLNCAHVFAPAIVERCRESGYGRIVNIASDASRVGSTGEAVYSAAKGGVVAFSKSLARELARVGVTVNVVSPGPTDTPMMDGIRATEFGGKVIDRILAASPRRRLSRPDEIAGAVAYFASDDAGFVTGQVLSVSGGLTMAG